MTLSSVTLRPYQPADRDEVVALWYDTTVHDQAFLPAEFWQAHRDAVANEYLPASETWVATADDRIVGFISLIDDLVGALFVSGDYQSAGIGGRLIAQARTRRAKLDVDVYARNQRAQAFYARCGFVLVSEFEQEESGETVCRMTLQ